MSRVPQLVARVVRAMHLAALAPLFAALLLGACGGAGQPSPSPSIVAAAIPSPSANAASMATPTATPAPTASPTVRVAATPSPGPVVTLPPAAHRPQTIHLILHAINDTVGSLTGCSGTGSCQGDFMVGDDPLFDAATGKEVGTFAYECFLVDPGSTLYHCPGITITLTGRGQIVFAEVIQHEGGGPPAIAPITGGTGEFLGATGYVTAEVLSVGGDFVITITG